MALQLDGKSLGKTFTHSETRIEVAPCIEYEPPSRCMESCTFNWCIHRISCIFSLHRFCSNVDRYQMHLMPRMDEDPPIPIHACINPACCCSGVVPSGVSVIGRYKAHTTPMWRGIHGGRNGEICSEWMCTSGPLQAPGGLCGIVQSCTGFEQHGSRHSMQECDQRNHISVFLARFLQGAVLTRIRRLSHSIGYAPIDVVQGNSMVCILTSSYNTHIFIYYCSVARYPSPQRRGFLQEIMAEIDRMDNSQLNVLRAHDSAEFANV